MSSLKLQGDTSGEITVTVPNVAGTHTLTLPKATGNIATDATVGLGMKNLIINGNFDIWQRSTNSGPVGGSGYWAADRWWSSIGASSSSMTLSQQTFTVGQTDVPNEPTYFHRYTQTGTSTGAGNFHQRIEDVRTAAGKTVTLSFYAKASSAITISTWANQNFGSGGSTTVSTATTSHSITTSWQKFTHTISIPSISGKTIGSSSYLRIYFGTPIGAGFDFDLAQVQLEVGENATPFEYRMYGTELALCQRYYWKMSAVEAYGPYGMGHGINSTSFRAIIHTPQTMRAYPSLGFSAASTFIWSFGNALTNIVPAEYSSNAFSVNCTTTGVSANGGYLLTAGNNTTSYIEASAEL